MAPTIRTETLPRPRARPVRDFADVLSGRRSSIGRSVAWPDIAELLWHAAGYKGFADTGRAGLPIAWSASPTAGGLQSIQIVCIADDQSRPKLYDPVAHAFGVLTSEAAVVHADNVAAVEAVIDECRGCTLRLIGDWSKLSAAYEAADTLLYRDAGCATATLCLCAEWLGLGACPLGFLGDAILPVLGFPKERFRAVGAVQITRP